MRYRDTSDLEQISRDAAVVVDFIGKDEYRRSLEKIGECLRLKGFVTPYDDTMFGLELELCNLEMLRQNSGDRLQGLPRQCHRGTDFLIGLGQTIPLLSAEAKTRLLGRLRDGLKEGLWRLYHELRVAASLSIYGWDVQFHDFEVGGGYDFLAARNGIRFEVEAKAISGFTGARIKPPMLNKLLVEVKQHFVWQGGAIPFIQITLSKLSENRDELQKLIAGCSEVARTRASISISDAQLRFVGEIPDMSPDKLEYASFLHASMRRKIVVVNPVPPKLVLELDCGNPIQLGRKIVRNINEAAREQFSHSNPGVIWTHIDLIPGAVFKQLSVSEGGRAALCDQIASATLLSEKRNHLAQLVFSGGTFLKETSPSTARSSFDTVVYNSPVCRFGDSVIFPGGHKKSRGQSATATA